jgi:excisionase family DNA binding protein
MSLISTKEASEKLGVSVLRVQQLIWANRLPAKKIGRDFVIDENDLGLVADRPNGRPPKTENGNDVPKSFAEVAGEFIGSIKSGLPTDLSSNKEYLEDLGKKSAEKEALRKRKQILNNE